MLKHVTALSIALLLALFALFAWWFLTVRWPFSSLPFGSTSMRLDGPPFLVSAVLLVLALVLFRRAVRWPAILLLIGAVALFVARLHDVVVYTAVDYQLFGEDSFLFPGQGCVTENPVVAMPISILRGVALCIPLAVFWFAYRAAQRI